MKKFIVVVFAVALSAPAFAGVVRGAAKHVVKPVVKHAVKPVAKKVSYPVFHPVKTVKVSAKDAYLLIY